jgi:hypothetical protein
MYDAQLQDLKIGDVDESEWESVALSSKLQFTAAECNEAWEQLWVDGESGHVFTNFKNALPVSLL